MQRIRERRQIAVSEKENELSPLRYDELTGEFQFAAGRIPSAPPVGVELNLSIVSRETK